MELNFFFFCQINVVKFCVFDVPILILLEILFFLVVADFFRTMKLY